jgi:hypothetical protein
MIKKQDAKKCFATLKKRLHLHSLKNGAIAQLVEQRTENPCVAGSIPAGTTKKAKAFQKQF